MFIILVLLCIKVLIFCLDFVILNTDNITGVNEPEKNFLLKLFSLKPFEAYLLIDDNTELCCQYNDIL